MHGHEPSVTDASNPKNNYTKNYRLQAYCSLAKNLYSMLLY